MKIAGKKARNVGKNLMIDIIVRHLCFMCMKYIEKDLCGVLIVKDEENKVISRTISLCKECALKLKENIEDIKNGIE